MLHSLLLYKPRRLIRSGARIYIELAIFYGSQTRLTVNLSRSKHLSSTDKEGKCNVDQTTLNQQNRRQPRSSKERRLSIAEIGNCDVTQRPWGLSLRPHPSAPSLTPPVKNPNRPKRSHPAANRYRGDHVKVAPNATSASIAQKFSRDDVLNHALIFQKFSPP